ncbi:MAG: hypothetical protein RIS20_1865 [Bacteroidota bacterium]|jgi:hypothetical protein
MGLQVTDSIWEKVTSKISSAEYQQLLQKNDTIISLRSQLKSLELQQSKLQFENDWLLNICIGLMLLCAYLIYQKIKKRQPND